MDSFVCRRSPLSAPVRFLVLAAVVGERQDVTVGGGLSYWTDLRVADHDGARGAAGSYGEIRSQICTPS
jgi:hypothetical protein